jgi:hypothetical protein
MIVIMITGTFVFSITITAMIVIVIIRAIVVLAGEMSAPLIVQYLLPGLMVPAIVEPESFGQAV